MSLRQNNQAKHRNPNSLNNAFAMYLVLCIFNNYDINEIKQDLNKNNCQTIDNY